MGGVVSAIGSVVGGAAKAVGSVVSSVSSALGPVLPLAAAAVGLPYLAAPSGFAALEAPSILGGGLTGAGMMTAGLDTAIGGSLLSTAGGLGVSSAFSGADSFISSLGGSTSAIPNSSSFSGLLNSLSNVASNTSQSILPGDQPGLGGSLGKYTNLIKSGMDIYNALNYGQGQSPTVAQQNADPYAQYRSAAAEKLNALMANPNLVYSMPGYKFAQQEKAKAIGRQAAATGQSISGNTLASLQSQSAATAQDWFNNYVNQLTQQAGATPQNAVAGQAAYSLAQDYQAKAEKARQTALLQGIMGAGSAVSGFFG